MDNMEQGCNGIQKIQNQWNFEDGMGVNIALSYFSHELADCPNLSLLNASALPLNLQVRSLLLKVRIRFSVR